MLTHHSDAALKLFPLICILVLAGGRAQQGNIDRNLASRYFHEADEICHRDNGVLWGVSLCGPMLFVDPSSREVIANQADQQGNLTKDGEVYVGRLPQTENYANTAASWAGIRWTMILWPLPTDRYARAKLMAHELWHRIQQQRGLPGSNPSNSHLDSMSGRIWLQLEWRALRSALTRQNAEQRDAIEDAVIFRSYRHFLFPNGAAEERALEMNEGLAEYTGVKLRGASDSESAGYIAAQLESFESRPTFVRSFAYASGPAYGFLLDAAGADWRKNLTPESDFGSLLHTALSVTMPQNLKQEAEKRSQRYKGDALRAAEQERENNRRKRVAGYRARFIEGPILILSLTEKVNYSFNPNNLETLDDVGIVYPTLRVTDAWGILTVSKGALVIRRGGKVARVHVSAPSNPAIQPLEGDGWQLELQKGWRLAPAERSGDYIVEQQR